MASVDDTEIRGKKILLRRCSPSDLDAFLEITPSDEYFHFVGEDPALSVFSSRDRMRQEFEQILHNPHFWFFWYGGALVGNAFFHRVDERTRSAYLALGIFKKADWRKGYGYDALVVLNDYGFSVMGLRSISLRVLEFNIGAMRLYERCGYAEVAREASDVLIEGQPAMDVVMQKRIGEDGV